MSEFLNAAAIPGIVVLVCLYYAYRVLVLKDTTFVRNVKSRKLLEAENEEFCKRAGILILLFALGTMVELGLEILVGAKAAMIACVLVLVFELYSWKKLADKFK